MTAVAVDEQFIGAGQVFLDDVLVGSTMADNVFRVMQQLAAPNINGVGGMLARTHYHTRLPWAELEVTLVELSDALLAVMIPGATSAAGSGLEAGKTIITGPDQTQRRLGAADYHKWLLSVPGADDALIEFEIAMGIAQSNADFTAADSENPLGPRVTIQSVIDPDDIETPQWRILRTPSGS